MVLRSPWVRAYEREHCARCKRYTPCLIRDARASPITEREYCAAADRSPPAMHPSHRCLALVLHLPPPPLPSPPNEAWAHSTLRVTGPVADGFWVRALVLLAHTQWAFHAGIQSVDVEYSSPADAYALRRTGRDGWSQFFERVGGGGVAADLRQLDCAAAARAWEQYANYATTHAAAARQRAARAALVASLPLRPRASFARRAHAFWTHHFGANRTVLGVHLRGTDKLPAVGVAAYLPLVDAFLCHRPRAALFVATDDRRMLAQLRAVATVRWPRTQLTFRDVARGGSVANRTLGLNPGYHAHLFNQSSVRHLAADVLLDTLLLSRCAFLLKSRSSVSEFATYWTPSLQNESYDFTLKGSPLPRWARACGDSALSSAQARNLVRRLDPTKEEMARTQ
ncbi:hypothetical protein AB1Y20_006924 [Prymnesium parvum]|uniref:Protein xylosyltransferase n=1 Tax=Prymnesium parvum TaxID=97485 RepID=A0AB34J1S2_PRYPA